MKKEQLREKSLFLYYKVILNIQFHFNSTSSVGSLSLLSLFIAVTQ